MGSKHSATLMSLISMAMLRYGKFPSRWLTARSILLFKHGDTSSLANWRQLTIFSCVYRVLTGAVSSAVQETNAIHQIFSPAQNGFVAGVNGCLEHTTMINEIIASANRPNDNRFERHFRLSSSHIYRRSIFLRKQVSPRYSGRLLRNCIRVQRREFGLMEA